MVAHVRRLPLGLVPSDLAEQGLTSKEVALFAAAETARARAYARYSGFHVGAAVLTKQGETFVGCNVENVSFPVGTCAERNALAAAVAARGPKVEIVSLALVATDPKGVTPCSPCGACRQAILELAPKATILFRQPDLKIVRRTSDELLPGGFSFTPGG